MRLLYVDPFQTYLGPHVVRNYQNSLQFQKRVFNWEPYDKPTVILTDISDYGNAGAGASPYSGIMVYIAPASRTLETMPSSERIFMLMNHELVHVANMDVANSQDRKWRRFFGGKPRQTNQHRESILEWNLPPMRFREVGTPSLFLSHARPALFFGALVTDPGKATERTLTTAGFQVDWKFTLAHRLPMSFSVGYAAGFEDGDEVDNEWMLSLKIL